MHRRSFLRTAGTFSLAPISSAGLASVGGQGNENALSVGNASPLQFGATCDGIRDDTEAVQKAIDECLSGPGPKLLIIPGPCRITRPLYIDRMVDKTIGSFAIVGAGPGAGFISDGTPVLFDSTIAMTKYPVSQYVAFYNILFSSKKLSNNYVISGKFLRISFSNCVFIDVHLCITDNYIQSWNLFRNHIQGQRKAFITCASAYDITFDSNQFEYSGPGIYIDGGASGFRMRGNLYESSLGPMLDASGVNGLYFHGNYTEANGSPTIKLGRNYGVSRGVSIYGNDFKGSTNENQKFYEVELGRAYGISSGGNYCSGDLYDNTLTPPSELCSVGDYAAGRLTRLDFSPRLLPHGRLPLPNTLLAKPGGRAEAPLANGSCTLVRSESAGSGICLPKAAPDGKGLSMDIVNDSDFPIRVFATDTDKIGQFAGNIGTLHPPGRVITYYCLAVGKWHY